MAILHTDYVDLLKQFDACGVKYIIVGAFAMAFNGRPRTTGDLDILVEPSRENAERIVRALEEFGFANTGISASDFTEAGQVLQLGYRPVRIDLLTEISGVSFERAWLHRQTVQIQDIAVAFLSREDLIANKRATGRLQDLADIEALGECEQ